MIIVNTTFAASKCAVSKMIMIKIMFLLHFCMPVGKIWLNLPSKINDLLTNRLNNVSLIIFQQAFHAIIPVII